MKPFLLDVNVLVALLWPAHVHNEPAHRWFGKNRHAGFKTCPITQAGFLRIVSHPRFSKDHVTVGEAEIMLGSLLSQPEHEFWPDSLTLDRAMELARPVTGHQQITDAYLVALTATHGGMLATFDRGVWGIRAARGLVEMIDC